MRTNRSVVAAILAVLAVPFSIAAIQDFGCPTPSYVAVPEGGPMAALADGLAALGGQRRAVPGGMEVVIVAYPDPDLRPADDPRWRRPELMDPSFFERVFLSGEARPGLHGPLEGARFGMTRDELRAEVGALWRWAEQGLSEFHRADVALEFDGRGEGLSAIAIRFPDDGGARAILAASWGAPVAALGQDGETRHIWLDARSRTRAVLHHAPSPTSVTGTSEVTYQRVQPIASLYRRGRGFAFESRAILGATPAELAAAYGSDFEFDASSPGSARLRFDPTDFAPERTQCTVAFQDGAAIALQIVVDHGWKVDHGPNLLEALRIQLGPVRGSDADADGERWTFDDRVTAQRLAGAPRVIISASR